MTPAETKRVRPWLIVLVALALFVVAGVVVIVQLPRAGTSGRHTTFETFRGPRKVPQGTASKSAVDVLLTVDSIDTTTGVVHLRLQAAPGEALPADGATLFTSIGSLPYLVIRPNQLDQERSASLSFESGDVSDYPFDRYKAPFALVALAGTDTSLNQAESRRAIPVNIEGVSSAAGIDITARTSVELERIVTITLRIQRTLATRGWVLAMMAIYWALAILAACITYLVVRRRREMETRLLAWLSAMVFALIAFRTAAPGAPPVGTYFDFYAVFESIGIVAACLVALIIVNITRP